MIETTTNADGLVTVRATNVTNTAQACAREMLADIDDFNARTAPDHTYTRTPEETVAMLQRFAELFCQYVARYCAIVPDED